MAKSPPVAKKRGVGCCSCGCFIFVLLIVLFLGLTGYSAYLLYHGTVQVSTSAPANIPTFDGGNDIYSGTLEKLKGFNHDVQNHLPATIHLTADEINTFIARNPGLAKNDVHAYVSLHDDQARIQASVPTSLFSFSSIKGRYLNPDVTFGVSFDSDAKTISLNLRSVQVGSVVFTPDNLAAIQAMTDPVLNMLLMKDADYKSFIDQVTSIKIKNSELIIETK